MNEIEAEAILVEDGVVTQMGGSDKLRSLHPEAEVRDLGGRTLMPGFVDAHGHFAAYAMSLLQLSLRDARDMDTLLGLIADRAGSTAEGGWVDARDYDSSKLSERRDPSLEELDSACPDRPLCLHHVSGHLGLFNSVAMRSLGLDYFWRDLGPCYFRNHILQYFWQPDEDSFCFYICPYGVAGCNCLQTNNNFSSGNYC